MSLVQAIISNDFLLVCSEQKAILSDGTICQNFRKTFMVSENAIIGLTGTIQDNYLLFQDFINKDFTLKSNKSYNLLDVYRKVDIRYREIEQEHKNSENKKIKIFSLVCGWNGSSFEGRTYFISSEPTKNIGITHITLGRETDVKIINCGKDVHYDNFIKFKERYKFNALAMKNTFKDVLDEGVKFDDTINTNALFDIIRRPKINN